MFFTIPSATMTWEINHHQENTDADADAEIHVWSCEFLPIVTETKIVSDGYELYSKAVELVYDTKKFNADEMYAFTKALRNNQSKSYAIINYNFEIQYDSSLEILSIIQKTITHQPQKFHYLNQRDVNLPINSIVCRSLLMKYDVINDLLLDVLMDVLCNELQLADCLESHGILFE